MKLAEINCPKENLHRTQPTAELTQSLWKAALLWRSEGNGAGGLRSSAPAAEPDLLESYPPDPHCATMYHQTWSRDTSRRGYHLFLCAMCPAGWEHNLQRLKHGAVEALHFLCLFQLYSGFYCVEHKDACLHNNFSLHTSVGVTFLHWQSKKKVFDFIFKLTYYTDLDGQLQQLCLSLSSISVTLRAAGVSKRKVTEWTKCK